MTQTRTDTAAIPATRPEGVRRVRSATLEKALDAVRQHTGGELSEQPGLDDADPDCLGIALATPDGRLFTAGESDHAFTMQSISKAFVYAIALVDRGFEDVLARVDVEPSGEAFNELSLEAGTGRPDNPMINAGALTVHGLVGEPGLAADARMDRILEVFSAAAGRTLRVDERTFQAEYATAHRNMAIAHMLRSVDMLPGEPQDIFLGYTRQCSVLVTCEDLAMMGATLASGGRQPLTGEQIFDEEVVRQVLSVLTTCGMYNSAGDWVSNVGLPAKSGVAGGILGVLPGALGLATYSPRLDVNGTSVRGHLLFEKLSAEHEMHFLDPRHWRNVSWRGLDDPIE